MNQILQGWVWVTEHPGLAVAAAIVGLCALWFAAIVVTLAWVAVEAWWETRAGRRSQRRGRAA